MSETQTRVPHDPETTRITIAATLIAATEASRRLDQGHTITSPAGYIRARTDTLIRAHGPTWHACLQADPNTPAETLAFGTIDSYAATAPQPPATTRTLDDGRRQRFIPGTGWTTETTTTITTTHPPTPNTIAAIRALLDNTTPEPRP